MKTMPVKAFEHLIVYSIARGCSLSISDSEGKLCQNCQDAQEAIRHVESVDYAALYIKEPEADRFTACAWVTADPTMEPQETVIEYNFCDYMTRWAGTYQLTELTPITH